MTPRRKDSYDAIVKQIEREDTLVNNRVNWFLVTQGFLLATVGIIVDAEIEKCWQLYASKGIAILSVFIGGCVLLGVIGAEISICKLRKRWNRMERDYIGHFPPPYGKGVASIFGSMPRILLPIGLIAAWIIIFFHINRIF